jgi:hypothetical protein
MLWVIIILLAILVIQLGSVITGLEWIKNLLEEILQKITKR